MNIKEMVVRQLNVMKAEGLCDPDGECGCHLEDLMPCGSPNELRCIAARVLWTATAENGFHTRYMVPLETKRCRRKKSKEKPQ